ncbi:MAG: hypothetical protein B0W54_17085 [Cellvibrio sp. 79]|nr:MAG: hypothetical protein B0W54_17085 [Cellvibrio sp. 79]
MAFGAGLFGKGDDGVFAILGACALQDGANKFELVGMACVFRAAIVIANLHGLRTAQGAYRED